jgi:hypothetical protein
MSEHRNKLIAVAAAALALCALFASRPADASIPSAIAQPQLTQPAAAPALHASYVLLSVAPDGSCRVDFCRNDPVNVTDPTGLDSFTPAWLHRINARVDRLFGLDKAAAAQEDWSKWDDIVESSGKGLEIPAPVDPAFANRFRKEPLPQWFVEEQSAVRRIEAGAILGGAGVYSGVSGGAAVAPALADAYWTANAWVAAKATVGTGVGAWFLRQVVGNPTLPVPAAAERTTTLTTPRIGWVLQDGTVVQEEYGVGVGKFFSHAQVAMAHPIVDRLRDQGFVLGVREGMYVLMPSGRFGGDVSTITARIAEFFGIAVEQIVVKQSRQ